MKTKYKYIIDVSLKGFINEINRTYEINDNITIHKIWDAILYTMKESIHHIYELKYKEKKFTYDSEFKSKNSIYIGEKRISSLHLQENDLLFLKSILKNWEFIIKVKKISLGHNDKKIVLLNGQGYGICEWCEGPKELKELIKTKSDEYDINDFDINKMNDKLDLIFNSD